MDERPLKINWLPGAEVRVVRIDECFACKRLKEAIRIIGGLTTDSAALPGEHVPSLTFFRQPLRLLVDFEPEEVSPTDLTASLCVYRATTQHPQAFDLLDATGGPRPPHGERPQCLTAAHRNLLPAWLTCKGIISTARGRLVSS